MTALRKFIESRAAPPLAAQQYSDWRDRVAGLLGFGTHAGKRVDASAAMGVTPFYRGIVIRAKVAGTLPIHTYQKEDDGTRRQVEVEGDYYLWGRPNREVPRATFWMTVFAQFALYENAYLYVVAGASGRPEELYPIEPHRVEIQRDKEGRKLYLIDSRTPLRDFVDEGELVHFQGFGIDGIRGRGPLVAGRNALGLALAAEEYAGRWFGDGSEVGAYLSAEQDITVLQAQQFAEMWEEAHSGGANRHRMPVLGKGTKYLTTDLDPEKSQIIPTRQYQVAEASRLTGVPEHLLGSHDKQSCLPAGSQVFTEAGPRPVEVVRPGERVWSMGENGPELQPVFRSEQTGLARTYTVATRTHRLVATGNHRVMVRRKVRGQREGSAGQPPMVWHHAWVPVEELRVGDLLVLLRSLPAEGISRAPNGRQLTEGFMEFLGLYLAEGSMSIGPSVQRINIAHHPAAPYMPHYQRMMSESFVRSAQGGRALAKDRPVCPITLQHNDRETAFSSTLAVRELLSLGMGGVAHTKRVPGWVFSAEQRFRVAFLRGYLDGDGSVNDRGYITWSSCNPLLLEDIRHLAWSVGVPTGRICRYSPRGEVEINGRVTHRGDIYQAWSYHAAENQRIGSHDPRYVERWNEVALPSKVSRFAPGYVGRGGGSGRPGPSFNLPGAYFEPIKLIEASEEVVPVFDLGVEGTHSFIAEGVVVHNSWGTGIAEQNRGLLTYTIDPDLVVVEQTISDELLRPAKRYMKFNRGGLLRGSNLERAQYLEILRRNEIINADEWRQEEDMAPRPDGGGGEYKNPNTSSGKSVAAAGS